MSFDILLDDDGDLPAHPMHGTGLDLLVQRIDRRVRIHRGEWMLDASVGLPFVQFRAQKPPQVEAIGALIRREIEDVPGVTRVETITGTYDQAQQHLSYEARVLIEGDAAVELVVEPFGEPGGNRTPVVRLVNAGPIWPA
jgi:hypothetical protein